MSLYNFHKHVIYQYTFRTHFTNSMEQTHSSEANSSTASHGTPCILWNHMDHYCVHNSLTLIHVHSQKNSVHALPSYFL